MKEKLDRNLLREVCEFQSQANGYRDMEALKSGGFDALRKARSKDLRKAIKTTRAIQERAVTSR